MKELNNMDSQDSEELLQAKIGESFSNDNLYELVQQVHGDDEICFSEDYEQKEFSTDMEGIFNG